MAPEDCANSASDGLWPSGLADEAAFSGEWETSRTLRADCLSDSVTFWALYVGTRTTLPKYNVRQCYKQHAETNTFDNGRHNNNNVPTSKH